MILNKQNNSQNKINKKNNLYKIQINKIKINKKKNSIVIIVIVMITQMKVVHH